jgi:hypothetical protein
MAAVHHRHTPGRRRFQYRCILKPDVPQGQAASVTDAAKAHLTRGTWPTCQTRRPPGRCHRGAPHVADGSGGVQRQRVHVRQRSSATIPTASSPPMTRRPPATRRSRLPPPTASTTSTTSATSGPPTTGGQAHTTSHDCAGCRSRARARCDRAARGPAAAAAGPGAAAPEADRPAASRRQCGGRISAGRLGEPRTRYPYMNLPSPETSSAHAGVGRPYAVVAALVPADSAVRAVPAAGADWAAE